MSKTTPTPDDQAKRDSDARLFRAYVAVFGNEIGQTESQRLVLADLKFKGFLERTTAWGTGQDVHHVKMEILEGKRTLLLEILLSIRSGLAVADGQPVKSKPKTLRNHG